MRQRLAGVLGLLRRVDPEILAALLACVLLMWGFFELADEIAEPGTLSIDERILLAFRADHDLSDPIGSGDVEEAMRDLTSLGSMIVTGLLTLIVLGFLLLQGRPRSALFLVVAIVGGASIGWLLKDAFDRPRPDVVPHMMEVSSASFPSGHTLIASVVYPTLGVMLSRVVRRLRVRTYLLLVGVALALIVGLTRVYLGVHYPTDVVAGWALGFTWALGCWLTVAVLQRLRKVEPEPEAVRGISAQAPP